MWRPFSQEVPKFPRDQVPERARTTIRTGGHFLQEDQREAPAQVVAEFIAGS